MECYLQVTIINPLQVGERPHYLLYEEFNCGLREFRNPGLTVNSRLLCLWATSPSERYCQLYYLPHIWDSMGFEPIPLLLVDPVGIEPTPLVLQTSVRTSYTKDPILTTTWLLSNFGGSYHSFLVVQGVTHPSVTSILLSPDKRLSTLGCFLVCGQQWTRTTPLRTDFTDRLPYPNDFCHPFVPRDGYAPPPFACKTNTLLLRQRGMTASVFF